MTALRNQAETTTFAAIEALSCSSTGDVSYLLAGLVWPALFGRPALLVATANIPPCFYVPFFHV